MTSRTVSDRVSRNPAIAGATAAPMLLNSWKKENICIRWSGGEDEPTSVVAAGT